MALNGSENTISVVYARPFGVGNLVISVLGTCGNASIVVGFLNTPTLRSKCASLIAALAVADLVTCLMFVQFSLMAMFEYTFIDNHTCFLLLLTGLFAMNAESVLILMVGVDRLLCIYRPVRYKHWKKSTYLPLMISPALVYAFVVVGAGYLTTDSRVIVPVCVPPTAYRDTGNTIWVVSAVLISLFVDITYVSAYTGAKKTRDLNRKKRRLLASLMVVAAVYSCSWMLTMIVVMTVQLLNLTLSLKFHLALYVGFLADVNASCNCALYIWRSREWRTAIVRNAWRLDIAMPPVSEVSLTSTAFNNQTASTARRSTRAASFCPPPLQLIDTATIAAARHSTTIYHDHLAVPL